MRRVETRLRPEIENQGFVGCCRHRPVELEDGRVLTQESGPCRGGPERPFTREELREKVHGVRITRAPHPRSSIRSSTASSASSMGRKRAETLRRLLTQQALTTRLTARSALARNS